MAKAKANKPKRISEFTPKAGPRSDGFKGKKAAANARLQHAKAKPGVDPVVAFRKRQVQAAIAVGSMFTLKHEAPDAHKIALMILNAFPEVKPGANESRTMAAIRVVRAQMQLEEPHSNQNQADAEWTVKHALSLGYDAVKRQTTPA